MGEKCYLSGIDCEMIVGDRRGGLKISGTDDFNSL